MSRTEELYIAMTAAALSLGGATAQAQQVGTASAVNPAATANLKTIVIGQSIAHKEHIQTKSSGSVQLLFLDKTSMTIGPNSDLTIDEYVYDPKANTGKLAATLGKGALRFVGGQISHNGDAEIKTASTLIGIRGGVMMTDGKGGIYSGYGTMTVTSGGRSVALDAGEFTQTQAGAPPTPPDLPPPGFVQQQIAIFQSAAGQTGGRTRRHGIGEEYCDGRAKSDRIPQRTGDRIGCSSHSRSAPDRRVTQCNLVSLHPVDPDLQSGGGGAANRTGPAYGPFTAGQSQPSTDGQQHSPAQRAAVGDAERICRRTGRHHWQSDPGQTGKRYIRNHPRRCQ